MVHDHARGLHEGVADGRADKFESEFLQGLAHGLGLGRDGRDLAAHLEMIDFLHPADKGPEQRHRVLQRQPDLGIAPRGIEFQAVADDPRIEHQLLDIGVAHGRDFVHIETEQHLPIVLAFLQDGDPRQTGLEPFEQKQLEQTPPIVQRHAPLLIVIGHVQRIVVAPKAAWHKAPGGVRVAESGILPPFESQPK